MADVIPFPRKSTDPVITRMHAESKIIRWSLEMLKAGHMPDDVRLAFATYFGDEKQP